ncbi:hypothetical protein HF086_008090 [Spodoptera exigua]|uniref:Uncharacterized protein n=1 Tax=Spodoptera exigua TaxID=7107 RepID=A0A922SJG8_SPOEX|nr:hypothetical protein HF086_008090 [Spodoptera exigua]
MQQLALTPNSRSFRTWVAPTVPLFFDIYFFNWTNSEKFPEEKPNLVQLAVYRSRFWGFLQQKGLAMGLAMFNQKIAISKLARELLFEGYDDQLLNLAKSLPSSTTGGAPPRNNSLDTDGYMEVTTGRAAGTLPGQIMRWNYEDHIPYYEGDCAQLTGSAGEFMPRNLTEDSVLPMFVPDLCRTVYMEYVDTGDQDGLTYNKYALTQRSFDN